MKRLKVVRTLAEFESMIAKAQHSGELINEILISRKAMESEEAKRIFSTAWVLGISQKRRPPFVQPDSEKIWKH